MVAPPLFLQTEETISSQNARFLILQPKNFRFGNKWLSLSSFFHLARYFPTRLWCNYLSNWLYRQIQVNF